MSGTSSAAGAVLELLVMLVADPRSGVLCALLLLAALIDARTHRIPNRLVIAGLCYALAIDALRPHFGQWPLVMALGGLATGFLLMLPMHLLGAMGAGDVKLMAMAGSFLGASGTVAALLWTWAIGGALAIVHVLRHGTARRFCRNVASLLQGGFLDAAVGVRPQLRIKPGTSAGRLPYGVSIALGTSAHLVSQQLGFT